MRDLFIWAVPNAGNPQKTQRYLGEWVVALDDMSGSARRSCRPDDARTHGLRGRVRPRRARDDAGGH